MKRQLLIIANLDTKGMSMIRLLQKKQLKFRWNDTKIKILLGYSKHFFLDNYYAKYYNSLC